MAGYDVERQDPLAFFRTELSPADTARQHQEWAVQAARDHQAAIAGWTVVATVATLLALAAVIHRRKIARTAGAATISALAAGVRAKRVVAAKRDGLISRVLAEADKKPSQQD